MNNALPDIQGTNRKVQRIERSSGLASLQLKEIWEYRDLLRFNLIRDIKSRYRQMALGPLWFIIKPLVNMVIFSLIFGGLARLPSDDIWYPLFTYAALLPWAYFSGAASRSANSLRSSMGMISKVYFPRLIVPLSAIIGGLVDFGVSFLILLGMMFFSGYPPRLTILSLPLFLLLAAATALALGLWTAGLSVRFRDLSFVTGYGLQAWMWATPVAFSSTIVQERLPAWAWELYQLNPMFWVIEGFRWALLDTGHAPQLNMLIPVSIIIAFLFTGMYVFRNAERTIVDYK